MGDRARSLTIDGVRAIRDLKVVELKAELERRGLSKSGSKKELVERLRSSVQFENTKSKATAAVNEEDVPNRWLQNEANLDNDFIREYFQSQKALYRQQIEARRQYRGETAATTSSPGPSVGVGSHLEPQQPTPPLTPESHPATPKHNKHQQQHTTTTPHPPPPSPPSHPPPVEKVRKATSGSVVLPQSPSTSNCSSRPSRSSARAARVLSRVSLEDSEEQESEEELQPQQQVRRSRKRNARHSHSEHQSEPPTEERCVPSLRIRLPDSQIVGDHSSRRTETSKREVESESGRGSRSDSKRHHQVVTETSTGRRQQSVISQSGTPSHPTRRQQQQQSVSETETPLPLTRRQQQLVSEGETSVSLTRRQQQSVSEGETPVLVVKRHQKAANEPESPLPQTRQQQPSVSEVEASSSSTRRQQQPVSVSEVGKTLTHTKQQQQQQQQAVNETETHHSPTKRQLQAITEVKALSPSSRLQQQVINEAESSPSFTRKQQQVPIEVEPPASLSKRQHHQVVKETEPPPSVSRQQQQQKVTEVEESLSVSRRQQQQPTNTETELPPVTRKKQQSDNKTEPPSLVNKQKKQVVIDLEPPPAVTKQQLQSQPSPLTRKPPQTVGQVEAPPQSTKRSLQATLSKLQPATKPDHKIDYKLDHSESRAVVALRRIPESDLKAARDKCITLPTTGTGSKEKVTDTCQDKHNTSTVSCVDKCEDNQELCIPKLILARCENKEKVFQDRTLVKGEGETPICETNLTKPITDKLEVAKPEESVIKSGYPTIEKVKIRKTTDIFKALPGEKETNIGILETEAEKSKTDHKKLIGEVEKSILKSGESENCSEESKPIYENFKLETKKPKGEVANTIPVKTTPVIERKPESKELTKKSTTPSSEPIDTQTDTYAESKPQTEKLVPSQESCEEYKPLKHNLEGISEIQHNLPKATLETSDPLLQALRSSEILFEPSEDDTSNSESVLTADISAFISGSSEIPPDNSIGTSDSSEGTVDTLRSKETTVASKVSDILEDPVEPSRLPGSILRSALKTSTKSNTEASKCTSITGTSKIPTVTTTTSQSQLLSGDSLSLVSLNTTPPLTTTTTTTTTPSPSVALVPSVVSPTVVPHTALLSDKVTQLILPPTTTASPAALPPSAASPSALPTPVISPSPPALPATVSLKSLPTVSKTNPSQPITSITTVLTTSPPTTAIPTTQPIKAKIWEKLLDSAQQKKYESEPGKLAYDSTTTASVSGELLPAHKTEVSHDKSKSKEELSEVNVVRDTQVIKYTEGESLHTTNLPTNLKTVQKEEDSVVVSKSQTPAVNKPNSFEPTSHSISSLLSKGNKNRLSPPEELVDKEKKDGRENQSRSSLSIDVPQPPNLTSEVDINWCNKNKVITSDPSNQSVGQHKNQQTSKEQSLPKPPQDLERDTENISKTLKSSCTGSGEAGNTSASGSHSVGKEKKSDLLVDIIKAFDQECEKLKADEINVPVSEQIDQLNKVSPDHLTGQKQQVLSEGTEHKRKDLLPTSLEQKPKVCTPRSLDNKSGPVGPVQPTHKFQSIESLIGSKSSQVQPLDKRKEHLDSVIVVESGSVTKSPFSRSRSSSSEETQDNKTTSLESTHKTNKTEENINKTPSPETKVVPIVSHTFSEKTLYGERDKKPVVVSTEPQTTEKKEKEPEVKAAISSLSLNLATKDNEPVIDKKFASKGEQLRSEEISSTSGSKLLPTVDAQIRPSEKGIDKKPLLLSSVVSETTSVQQYTKENRSVTDGTSVSKSLIEPDKLRFIDPESKNTNYLRKVTDHTLESKDILVKASSRSDDRSVTSESKSEISENSYRVKSESLESKVILSSSDTSKPSSEIKSERDTSTASLIGSVTQEDPQKTSLALTLQEVNNKQGSKCSEPPIAVKTKEETQTTTTTHTNLDKSESKTVPADTKELLTVATSSVKTKEVTDTSSSSITTKNKLTDTPLSDIKEEAHQKTSNKASSETPFSVINKKETTDTPIKLIKAKETPEESTKHTPSIKPKETPETPILKVEGASETLTRQTNTKEEVIETQSIKTKKGLGGSSSFIKTKKEVTETTTPSLSNVKKEVRETPSSSSSSTPSKESLKTSSVEVKESTVLKTNKSLYSSKVKEEASETPSTRVPKETPSAVKTEEVSDTPVTKTKGDLSVTTSPPPPPSILKAKEELVQSKESTAETTLAETKVELSKSRSLLTGTGHNKPTPVIKGELVATPSTKFTKDSTQTSSVKTKEEKVTQTKLKTTTKPNELSETTAPDKSKNETVKTPSVETKKEVTETLVSLQTKEKTLLVLPKEELTDTPSSRPEQVTTPTTLLGKTKDESVFPVSKAKSIEASVVDKSKQRLADKSKQVSPQLSLLAKSKQERTEVTLPKTEPVSVEVSSSTKTKQDSAKPSFLAKTEQQSSEREEESLETPLTKTKQEAGGDITLQESKTKQKAIETLSKNKEILETVSQAKQEVVAATRQESSGTTVLKTKQEKVEESSQVSSQTTTTLLLKTSQEAVVEIKQQESSEITTPPTVKAKQEAVDKRQESTPLQTNKEAIQTTLFRTKKALETTLQRTKQEAIDTKTLSNTRQEPLTTTKESTASLLPRAIESTSTPTKTQEKLSPVVVSSNKTTTKTGETEVPTETLSQAAEVKEESTHFPSLREGRKSSETLSKSESGLFGTSSSTKSEKESTEVPLVKTKESLETTKVTCESTVKSEKNPAETQSLTNTKDSIVKNKELSETTPSNTKELIETTGERKSLVVKETRDLHSASSIEHPGKDTSFGTPSKKSSTDPITSHQSGLQFPLKTFTLPPNTSNIFSQPDNRESNRNKPVVPTIGQVARDSISFDSPKSHKVQPKQEERHSKFAQAEGYRYNVSEETKERSVTHPKVEEQRSNTLVDNLHSVIGKQESESKRESFKTSSIENILYSQKFGPEKDQSKVKDKSTSSHFIRESQPLCSVEKFRDNKVPSSTQQPDTCLVKNQGESSLTTGNTTESLVSVPLDEIQLPANTSVIKPTSSIPVTSEARRKSSFSVFSTKPVFGPFTSGFPKIEFVPSKKLSPSVVVQNETSKLPSRSSLSKKEDATIASGNLSTNPAANTPQTHNYTTTTTNFPIISVSDIPLPEPRIPPVNSQLGRYWQNKQQAEKLMVKGQDKKQDTTIKEGENSNTSYLNPQVEMARRRKTEVKEESEVPVQDKKTTSEETGSQVEEEATPGRPRRTTTTTTTTTTKTICEESSNGDLKQQKILENQEEENEQPETPRQLRRSTRSRSVEKSVPASDLGSRMKRTTTTRGRGSQSSDQDEEEEETKAKTRRTRRTSRASSVEDDEDGTRSPLRRSTRRRTISSRSQGDDSEEDVGGGGGGDVQPPSKTITLESIQELNESQTETPKKTTDHDKKKEQEEEKTSDAQVQRKTENKVEKKDEEEEKKTTSTPTKKDDENQLELPQKKKEEEATQEDKKETKEREEGEDGKEDDSSDNDDDNEEKKGKEESSDRPKLLRSEMRKVEEKLKLLEQKTRKERSSSRSSSSSRSPSPRKNNNKDDDKKRDSTSGKSSKRDDSSQDRRKKREDSSTERKKKREESSPERRRRREDSSPDRRRKRDHSPDRRKKKDDRKKEDSSSPEKRKKEETSPEKKKKSKEDGKRESSRREEERKREQEKTRSRPRLTRNEVKVAAAAAVEKKEEGGGGGGGKEKEEEEAVNEEGRNSRDREKTVAKKGGRSPENRGSSHSPVQKKKRRDSSSSSSSSSSSDSSSSSRSRSRSRKRYRRSSDARKREGKKNREDERKEMEGGSEKTKKNRHSHSRSRSPKTKISKTSEESGKQQHEEEEEEKKKEAPVVSIDYSTFKSVRKVSLSRGRSRDEDQRERGENTEAGQGGDSQPKKRRWASSSTHRPSLDISSASLKTIIPDVKPLSASEVHMGDEDSEAESGEASDGGGGEAGHPAPDSTTSPSPGGGGGGGGGNKREEGEVTATEDDRKTERKVREATPISSGKQRRRSKSPDQKPARKIHVYEGPAPAPSKPAIPSARNPPSRVVVIWNLVRPFTPNQLRELLLRTGRLVEAGFWLDNIKSTCLAMYETEDQALETRMALHGVQWPVSNPKKLFVDFSTEAEMKKKIEEFSPPQAKVTEERRDDRWKREGPVREWDLAKIGERSPGERERERERLRREREEERLKEQHKPHSPTPREQEKKVEEPPPKMLDDLFIKTKATPAIYWLPLTAEQIAEKEAQRRIKMAEVERRQAEMKAAREKQEAEWERVRTERRKEREREREKEREREREREKERNARRASRSRSRSRRRGDSRSPAPRRSPRRSPAGKRSPGKSPRRSPAGRSRRSVSRDSPRRSRRRSRTRTRSRSRS